VPGEFAESGAVLECLVAAVEEILIGADDAGAERGVGVALVAAQEAILRGKQFLRIVIAADDVIEAVARLRDEADLLDEAAVLVGADRRIDRARVVVVEVEEARLCVEAGVLADAAALVIVVAGRRGERGETEIDVGLERDRID